MISKKDSWRTKEKMLD